eukprot:s1188_g25.t4
MNVSASQTSGASQTVTSVRAGCGIPWAHGQLPQVPQMQMHGVHSFVPVVMRTVVPRRVEPVVMEPVVVVQRQFSAPCLVRKASLTAPAAPPPGQGHGFVQPEGAAARAKVEAVCVPAAPLPTWAAPATPPQGSRVSPSHDKPENDSETGIPADGSERELFHSNGTLASESEECVSEKDFSRMRAKLEATRNELVEKMAELMKLEANLSVALGEKPTAWTAWSCLPSASDSPKVPEQAEPAEPSDPAQSSVEMQDRAIGVVAEEYESESSVASFQAPEKGCNTRAVGTTTDDLMAATSDETVKDLNTSQTSSSPDKKDGSRSDTARSAPSRAGSGGSGSSGRVSALLKAPPVSARLSLRRRGSQTANEASDTKDPGGELSGLQSSASATMAKKLRRSSSAELTGGSGSGLLASDVARLVASPEIGTLNDFLPHPIPEPEVLRERSAEASASNAHLAGRQKRASAKAAQAKEMQRSSSEARLRGSRAGSREAVSREVKPRLPQTASNERSTGSRMLSSQQLTCNEQPRQSPSPQRLRPATPQRGPIARAATPQRGAVARAATPQRGAVARAAAGSASTSQSQPRAVPTTGRESSLPRQHVTAYSIRNRPCRVSLCPRVMSSDAVDGLDAFRRLESNDFQVEIRPAPGQKRPRDDDEVEIIEAGKAGTRKVVLCDAGPRSGGMAYYLGRQWERGAVHGEGAIDGSPRHRFFLLSQALANAIPAQAPSEVAPENQAELVEQDEDLETTVAKISFQMDEAAQGHEASGMRDAPWGPGAAGGQGTPEDRAPGRGAPAGLKRVCEKGTEGPCVRRSKAAADSGRHGQEETSCKRQGQATCPHGAAILKLGVHATLLLSFRLKTQHGSHRASMADRSLAVLDRELAERVALVSGFDVRLVRINSKTDHYHVLQGLQDCEGETSEFYCYQCWGETGTPGNKKLDGPFSEREMREAFAGVFEKRTGSAWGSLKPGERVADGNFWWQQVSAADEQALWQYYVHDGVDGKRRGWYPYEDDASALVEEMFAQHVSNDQEKRTAVRTVSSGYFSYRIDLEAMTQENARTGKVRAIRRFTKTATESTQKRAAKRPPADRKKVAKTILKTKSPKRIKPKAREPSKPKAGKLARPARPTTPAKPAKVPKVPKVPKAKAKVATGKDAKAQVFQGKFTRTSTGLKKKDLKKNKYGKVVSKRLSEAGRKNFVRVACWIAACQKARDELGITGFVAIRKDTELYKKAKELCPHVEPHVLGTAKRLMYLRGGWKAAASRGGMAARIRLTPMLGIDRSSASLLLCLQANEQ